MSETGNIENNPETLDHLKRRAETLENARSLSSGLIKYVIISMAIAGILFITNLFTTLDCLWVLIALVSLLVAVISTHFWYQCRRAEEFEAELRKRKLRELDGPARCIHLDGNLPDGKGRIGECARYSFTLDSIPYCIYCREYTPSVTHRS